jgi:hypothetical protein
MSPKFGRNAPCPCGSGKKFKKCCLPGQRAAALVHANDAEAKRLRFNKILSEDPAVRRLRKPHKERHCAYHEAGHALLNMLFHRDLNEVTIVPFITEGGLVQFLESGDFAGGGCVGIDHDIVTMTDEELQAHVLQEVSMILAGKLAENLFCKCGRGVDSATQDKRDIEAYVPYLRAQVLQQPTNELIQRHRPQLDAIAQALIEHETLSGSQVFEAMVSSGWNPETDCDPDQFYGEALGDGLAPIRPVPLGAGQIRA